MENNIKQEEFSKLVDIMKKLRGKKGCPWDRKQTHESIMSYLLEETYEAIEAINKKDKKNLKEELGDILLQVVFHAQIANERNYFSIDDVLRGINSKLITRHPHVFGDKKGLSKDWQVRDFWEKHKKETKKRDSVIDGVPAALPALLRARRLVSKAQSTGFKWRTEAQILRKVGEELCEVKDALKHGKKMHIQEEIGDLFFALVSLAYFCRINPENALQKTSDKFIKRFKKIEKYLYKDIREKEMLELWEKSKGRKIKSKKT